jgi:O-antigen/teichoic acid export membrane protein
LKQIIYLKHKIQNNKNLFWNIIGSIGVKGFAMLVNILAMPAYLNYFSDNTVLGVWFTIISILNWILTFDLGIGNGLRNHLVEAFVANDSIKAKKYISSAYFSIGSIALILGAIGYILLQMVDWNNLLNIPNQKISNETLIQTIQLIFIGIIIQLFLRLIISILYALQKTALSNFLSLLSNVLILVFLLLFRFDNTIEGLSVLSYVYIFSLNVPLLIASVIIFSTQLIDSKPSLEFFKKEYAGKILKLGSLFLGIQLSLLIINSTDQFLISRFYTPDSVVEYNVYYRIFSIYITFFSLITIPIWSAVTKAYTEKRIDWIMKVYKYLNLVGIGLVAISIITALMFQPIVNIWLGEETFTINTNYAFVFATYSAVFIFIYSANCIANGISHLRPQFIGNLIAALIKVPLTIFLSQYFEHWILIIAIDIFILLPTLIIIPITNKKKLLS